MAPLGRTANKCLLLSTEYRGKGFLQCSDGTWEWRRYYWLQLLDSLRQAEVSRKAALGRGRLDAAVRGEAVEAVVDEESCPQQI